MNRNKLKGFTLIELLAVLTILGFISLIAVAIVNGVIKDSKTSATKVSAKSYANTVNDNILSSKLNDFEIPDGSYRILRDGNICVGSYADNECNGKVLELNIQKGNPTDGTVVINNRKVSSLINAKFNDEVISYDFTKDKILEYTTPEINDFSVTRYTNSLKLNFSTLNATKYSCVYGQQDDYKETGIINGAKTECMINDLVPGTTYYYKISVTSSSGETVERTGTAQTLSIVTPVMTVAPSGYSLTKSVTINYTRGDIEEPIYYFYTTSSGTTNNSVMSCGDGFEPGECSTTGVTNLQPNNWYRLSEYAQSVVITYDSNTTIIAKASDNRVTVATSQLIITNIDKTAPTVKVDDIIYGNDAEIYLRDTQSGIKYFAVTQSNTAPTATDEVTTSTGNVLNKWYATVLSNDNLRVTFTGLSAGEYYAWSKDNLGNYISVKFKVKKADDEFHIEPRTEIYTGQPIPANTVTTDSGNAVTYTYYGVPNCKGEPISVPINVGNYSVKVEVSDSANYNAASKCVDHRIIETDVLITMSSQQGIAKGDSSLTFTVSPNVNGAFTFSSNKTSIATVSPMSINAVGGQTYTITVSTHDLGKAKININFIPTDSNYNEVNLYYDVSVLETVPVPTSQLTCKKNLKYTGSEQTLIIAETEGLIYTNHKQTNAGDYTVTATIDPAIELIWEDSTTTPKTFTCSIGRATDQIQVTPANVVYNRTNKSATVTSTSGLTPTVNYYSNSTCTTAATPLNVGTYYLSATTAGNSNYNPGSSGCVAAVTITAASLTPTASCSNKVYDGNTNASCTINLATIYSGDSVSANKSCSFNNATVGNGKTVTCSSLSLTGTNAGNYSLTTNSVTTNANITQQPVNPPSNVQVSTAGIVTWTASSNATGYQISIDGTNYTSASSGVNYLSTIIGSTGTRRIYVRAVNSGTTNYSSPSSAATKDVSVFTLTIGRNNTSYGTVSPSSYNVISGATYTTSSNTLSVKSGSTTLTTVTATPTAVAGYTTTFSSWSSTSGTITGNTTVTANFARNQNTATLTYYANGHGTAPSAVTMYYTTATNAANAITGVAGYTFTKWCSNGSGGTPCYSAGQQIKAANVNPSTTNLYAIWNENTAVLSYDANGHGTAPSSVTMKYSAATNAASAISATGWGFVKWCTVSDGSGTCYNAGQQIKGANSEPNAMTLYAIWIDNQAPTITSASISNVTATGYDVTVTGVTDNGGYGVNRVQFPTWTTANGQDEIQANWTEASSKATGTDKGNGTWTYRVNTVDHKNEAGQYNTHIYTYDNNGNYKCVWTGTANVPSSTTTPLITYDFNKTISFSAGQYLDTGYVVNWDRDFTIEVKATIPTSGTNKDRYLLAGNYYQYVSGTKDLSIEVNEQRQLRVWINNGDIGGHLKKSDINNPVKAGEEVTYVFTWNASTKKYTFTARGAQTNVSIGETYYNISGSVPSQYKLRAGTADNRGSAPYSLYTLSKLSITTKQTYGQAMSDMPTPTFAGNTFNGWYSTNIGGTQVSSSTPAPAVNTTYYANWGVPAISMTASNPSGSRYASTGTTKVTGYLTGSTITFTCTGSGGNYPKQIVITGGNTVTNSGTGNTLTATYTITNPTTSMSPVTATCTGIAGNTVTASSISTPIVRKFALSYSQNGSGGIGATASDVQYLVANSTASDGGHTVVLPSITKPSGGIESAVRGWSDSATYTSRTQTSASPIWTAGNTVNICARGTSGCTRSGTVVDISNGSGTLYATTWKKVYNPTKTAGVTTSNNASADGSWLYFYNGTTTATFANQCPSARPHLVCLQQKNSSGGAYDAAYVEFCGSSSCSASVTSQHLTTTSGGNACAWSCRANAGGA